MKKYKLQKELKVVLIILILLLIETFYLEIYLNRIEKIENGVNINESK